MDDETEALRTLPSAPKAREWTHESLLKNKLFLAVLAVLGFVIYVVLFLGVLALIFVGMLLSVR
jgi:hypothetical protein